MCISFSSCVHMFKGTCMWQVYITCFQGQKTTSGDVTQLLSTIIFETMSLPNLELSRYAGPADQQVSGMIGLSGILQGWDYRTAPPWVLECELRFFTDNHFPRTLPPWLALLPSSISPFACLSNVLYRETTRSTLSHHSQIQWKLNNMDEMARLGHWTMTGGHDPWDGESR